jgi:hypothetical protein
MLLSVPITSSTGSLPQRKDTYRGDKANKISVDQSGKDSARLDEKVLLKDREIRIDVSSPNLRLSIRWVSCQGIVN